MERFKNKFLRLATAAAIVGATGAIGFNSDSHREVSATNNTANTETDPYVLRDFGVEGGVKIGFITGPWPRYLPTAPIGFRYPGVGVMYTHFIPATCNSESEDRYNCFYLIPEARDWREFFSPIYPLTDESVGWDQLPDGAIVRSAKQYKSFFPVIGK